jgi:hypothetical protein
MNQFKSEPNRYLTSKIASEHFYERLQRINHAVGGLRSLARRHGHGHRNFSGVEQAANSRVGAPAAGPSGRMLASGC